MLPPTPNPLPTGEEQSQAFTGSGRPRLTQTAGHAASDHPSRNILVLTTGNLGRIVMRKLQQHNQHWAINCFEPSCGASDTFANIEKLPEYLQNNFVEELIVAMPCEPVVARRAVQIARDNHLDVKVIPDLCGYDAQKFQKVGNIPLLTLHEQRRSPAALRLKRILDVGISALLLVLISPLLLLIAGMIFFESGAPVLYISRRIGRNGWPFRCYKFRSMVPNADDRKRELRRHNQRSGPIFKIADDPRITPIGKFLRRYSLDELPQLWNVLKGDMSLVGPRPHPADDFERYHLDHLKRLRATPGLTGLWQVTARHDSSFSRSMELDLEYIRNWSLGMDFRILRKTVSAVFSGSGT